SKYRKSPANWPAIHESISPFLTKKIAARPATDHEPMSLKFSIFSVKSSLSLRRARLAKRHYRVSFWTRLEEGGNFGCLQLFQPAGQDRSAAGNRCSRSIPRQNNGAPISRPFD